jgi:hypothetical protein
VSWGAWCVAARHADRERRGWLRQVGALGWGGRFFYGPNATHKADRDRRQWSGGDARSAARWHEREVAQ